MKIQRGKLSTMQKNHKTHISMLLDNSGSMQSVANDVVGGFNSFIEEQKAIPGEATLDLVFFDDYYQVQFENKPLVEVEPLTHFPVRGCTALVDAMGTMIDNLGKRLRALPPLDRPEKVVMVIFTDGYENASKKYTLDAVKEKIQHQQNVYSWEFVFLGAGMDSIATASGLGIRSANVGNFSQSAVGYGSAYSCLSQSVGTLRTVGHLESWEGKDLDSV